MERQGSRGCWRPLGEGGDPGLVLGPLAGEGWVHALEQGGLLLGAKLFCTVCSVLILRCSQTLESLYLPPN